MRQIWRMMRLGWRMATPGNLAAEDALPYARVLLSRGVPAGSQDDDDARASRARRSTLSPELMVCLRSTSPPMWTMEFDLCGQGDLARGVSREMGEAKGKQSGRAASAHDAPALAASWAAAAVGASLRPLARSAESDIQQLTEMARHM